MEGDRAFSAPAFTAGNTYDAYDAPKHNSG
jgi:hypothetical protein